MGGWQQVSVLSPQGLWMLIFFRSLFGQFLSEIVLGVGSSFANSARLLFPSASRDGGRWHPYKYLTSPLAIPFPSLSPAVFPNRTGVSVWIVRAEILGQVEQRYSISDWQMKPADSVLLRMISIFRVLRPNAAWHKQALTISYEERSFLQHQE